jgi:PAS domain-containing protein
MVDKAENHSPGNGRKKREDGPNGGKTPITPIGKSRLTEAIRHGGSIYQTMVEAVRDYAIFLLDPAGYIATWNAGAERLKGYSADEIIGQHFSVFYPKEA